MDSQELKRPHIVLIVRTILAITVVASLPAVAWNFFGWLHLLLPVVPFIVLTTYGPYVGRRFVITGATFALLVHILLGQAELFVFTAILLLAGYVLYISYSHGSSPVVSGCATACTLAGCWILALIVLNWGNESAFYHEFTAVLQDGLNEAQKAYSSDQNINQETRALLETAATQMQRVLPLFMPAIIGSGVLCLTWMNIVLANVFVFKKEGASRWPLYGQWQLPDRLIWLAIALGISAAIPSATVRVIAINGLLLISVVYCFQGLAIVSFFMKKWHIPSLLSALFYFMVIVQFFGHMTLLVLGVADVWFDIRKIKYAAESIQE
ncbi:MAG: hypothetical protein CSB23_01895 [Deltaproteobacteria bacterium]|nr:MAG: hypothetical protein CSB23_01895 [Deltaproteobacteria bacterium]